ncbi:MAG TPA: M20/M25/M40 family metallo-hydrolase [Candidatus Binataceae bacterium]|nr:M20/M25/M40 family metallo-hydrolase [Candidatus Binataceae bacterium]
MKTYRRIEHVLRVVAAAAAIAMMSAAPAVAQNAAAPDWGKLDAEALDYFRAYVRFDTTNPPGNTSAAIAYLKEILDGEGIQTKTFESTPGMVSLVARIPGPPGIKPLILMSHADVVPVVAKNWTHQPFSADLSDGYVWGRGTIDNKAHGIMALMTMLVLKRNHVALRRGIEMMVNADEEAGGANGAQWMVKNHWDAIDPAFAFNEGGVATTGWLGIQGTTIPVAVTEKRVMWLHLTVHGKGGHGSVPRPDNPNLIMVRALDRLLAEQPPISLTPVVAEAFKIAAPLEPFPESMELTHPDWPGMLGLAQRSVLGSYPIQALLRDTISLTMLNAGMKVNVVPSTSEASLDCRLLPGTDAEAFIRRMEELLGPGEISIDYIQRPDDAPASPSDGEAWEAIQHVAKADFGGSIVVPWMTSGGTDSRFIRAHGVPAYGFVPVILPASELARIHGDDERLSTDNLNLGIKATYDLAADLCAAKQ